MSGDGRNIQKKQKFGRSSGKYEKAIEMELKKYVMVWGGTNILCPLHVGYFLSR
jgi:hypothetical protein